MNILFLAPQPFYQERGTPIAESLMLRVLSERGEHVDVLTYHEGADVSYPNVKIHRIPALPFVHDVRPGFSGKKLLCDFVMFFKAVGMVLRGRYDVIHSVEEAAFMAWLIRLIFRVPYIYDMDSSLSQQIVQRFRRMAWLAGILAMLEGVAIAGAEAIIPVCEEMAESARKHRAKKVLVLQDISLVGADPPSHQKTFYAALPAHRGVCFAYLGNLEDYQGIDLLLESFAMLVPKLDEVMLIVVGGAAPDVVEYRKRAEKMGLSDRVHFLGPRPLTEMGAVFDFADVLVSPRIKGGNTPMKIYSYMDSGKPVLATDISSHRQVLNRDVALLAPPRPAEFAEAMCRIAEDPAMRERLAANARRLAAEQYSFGAFRTKVNGLYDWLGERVARVGSTA